MKNRKKNQNDIFIDDMFLNNNILEKQKTKIDSSKSENEEKVDNHPIEKKRRNKKNISRRRKNFKTKRKR